MAAKARDRALTEHTYAHRIRQVMHEVLAPELVAAALDRPASQTLEAVLTERENRDPQMSVDEICMRALLEVERTWANC